MAARNSPVQKRRETVSTFCLSDHVRNRLRYDEEKRCITKQILSDAIQEGDRRDNPNGDADTAIFYTESGITFKVLVNTISEKVVTAYPVKFKQGDAIRSNRWTQTQIRSVQERVQNGKTTLL